MPLSLPSAKSLVTAAVNGNLKSLGDLLFALCRGEPYQSGAGDPNGVFTPQAIGDRYFDTTNLIFYRAYGLLNTNWQVDSGSGSGLVTAGATLTLTRAAHNGKTTLLNSLTGSIVTLPAATGTGSIFRFKVSVLATSNSHIVKVANGTDIIQGLLSQLSDNANAMLGWTAGAADDTITLNRTTTGSLTRGEAFEIQDVASGLFLVTGLIQASGTEATPFSSTV